MKDKDLEYIKQFSKIFVSRICRENNVNYQNLMNGRSTPENSKKIRNAIESEVVKIYMYEKAIENIGSDEDEKEIETKNVG